jgi:hypothetical protein
MGSVPLVDMSGRLRTWAGNLLLLFGGMLVAMAAAELLVRILAPQPLTAAFAFDTGNESIHRLDSTLGFVLRAGISEPFIFGTHVRTSALGLRDHEYGPKQPGEFRVLSLGDSYAFGFGVEIEQSYTKLLERELRQQYPGVAWSVIDAGVVGYGTAQERLAFQQLGGLLHVDFVLASFSAANDVYDNALFEERLRTHLQTAHGFLSRHSHAARLLLRVMFPVAFFLENRDAANIRKTIRLLAELESDFNRAGIPYLMLVIPARHQIRPRVEPAARLLMDVGLDDFVFRQNRSVIDHFQHASVPYLDLLPALAHRDSVTPVSFREDSHLNAVGHDVVAQAIIGKLRDLLPPLLNHAH